MVDLVEKLSGPVVQTVDPDEGEMTGLLAVVERHADGRGLKFALGLLRGWSRDMAAASAGVSDTTIRRWEERYPELGMALERIERVGFAVTFERELYTRALAGPDDRSSARLLEIVVKSRDAKYRDKSQVEITHALASRKAMAGITRNWQQADENAE